MDEANSITAANGEFFSFYTLLPGEECLLELKVSSFDDESENASVSVELTGIIDRIKAKIEEFTDSILAKFQLPCFKTSEEGEVKKYSVFVVTNMRCFISSYYAAKGKSAGFCPCSTDAAAAIEHTDFEAFPRNVLTEYNSYTCKKEKIVTKSGCLCGQKNILDKYSIVLTVGLNTKGEKSNISPSRKLIMTLEQGSIASYDQINGIIAKLSQLAQQAN